jgi:hypothetical protein
MNTTNSPSERACSTSPHRSVLGSNSTAEEERIFRPQKSKKINCTKVVSSPLTSEPRHFLEALFRNNQPANRHLKGILDNRSTPLQEIPSQPPTLGKRQPDILGLAYYSSRCREISKKHSSNEDLILAHFDKCKSRLQKIAERF